MRPLAKFSAAQKPRQRPVSRNLRVPSERLGWLHPQTLLASLLVLTARGSEAAGGSGPHTPAIVSVWAGDPAEQGWRLGRPGPSWKPRGQVQGQASSAGSTPAGGFPETGHSSWERFPGPPGRTWPQALSAEGRGGGQGRDRPGPSLHMPSREPPLDRCTRTHVRTCVLVCARSLSVNHRDRPQT